MTALVVGSANNGHKKYTTETMEPNAKHNRGAYFTRGGYELCGICLNN